MHGLNLSILASARIQLIDNAVESYKNTTFFFELSPKKETLLIYTADIRRLDTNRQQILTGMYETWWSERDLAYEHFCLAFAVHCGSSGNYKWRSC